MRFYFIAILFVSISFLTSCIKDTQSFTPYTNLGKIELLVNQLKEEVQVALIDPEIDNTIISKDNDLIIIPKNTLIYQDGTNAKGSVLIKYRVSRSRGTDVIHNRNTISQEGKALHALFNVYIDLSQGERVINIHPSSQGIKIDVPFKSETDNAEVMLHYWHNDLWNSEIAGENLSKVSPASWKTETNNGTILE